MILESYDELRGKCLHGNDKPPKDSIFNTDDFTEETTTDKDTCLKICRENGTATGCDFNSVNGCWMYTLPVSNAEDPGGALRHTCWILKRSKMFDKY